MGEKLTVNNINSKNMTPVPSAEMTDCHLYYYIILW